MGNRTTPNDFQGRHWETGSICNALACLGAKAPHTGQPYSEALMLGVSGGIAMGYFTFEYKGYLPHLALLTRNTFDPMEAIFDRLAMPREVQQTTNAATAEAKLIETLDAGQPAIVWADWLSLSHNAFGLDPKNWAMLPMVVHGYEGDTFLVADRSRRTIPVSAAELGAARGRVKEDRFRLMTLDAPPPAKLAAAVQKGLWACIGLFTEKPPRGGKDNFGFAAYQKWAKLLVNERNKAAWARLFPPGERMYQALAGAPGQPGVYGWGMTWGAGDGAERGVFADFVDEAATLLKKPGLKEVAAQFRQSHRAWCDLAEAALPEEVRPFAEARGLLQRRHDLFIEQGRAALPEIQTIDGLLGALQAAVSQDFPLSAAQAADLRANLRDRVLAIYDIESKAIETLQAMLA